MSTVAEVTQSIRREPFIAIELIWGLALFFDGLYLLLPNYVAVNGTVLAEFVTSPYVSIGIAVFYIVVGVVTVLAALANRFRNISTFLLFLVFLFTMLIRLLAVGFFPTTWVWPALLAVTVAVDYWQLKWKPSTT